MKSDKYPFKEVEAKWQKYWQDNNTYKVTEDEKFPKEKRLYVLDMFPYPSGAGLHVGHPEGYTATDIYSRFKRMNGYNVLHPMGFDSFGLPAENYALQTGTHPQITTDKNIQNFTRQIKALGFSYDWDRCVRTSDSSYYKWTQWIFLKLFEKGLAYESQMPINWCNHCKTGLANEEVINGRCERCSNEVVRRPIRQWVLKITEYAERLLKDLDLLDWPESVKSMQRNWIGKSIGASVNFKAESGDNIEVFTTRADTLFGATYMVLSPEHPLVNKLTTPDKRDEVIQYQKEASKKSDLDRTDLQKEKTGVFIGSYAINPVNGRKIPIWISDYVLSTYGTGAIMAVPAHDKRDHEFAKKFSLPIIEVLKSPVDVQETVYEGDGVHVNSDFLNGLGKQEAIDRMIEYIEQKGIGHKTINYKLRDWIFSRQRFWGEPIPLVHCPKCGVVPLKEDDLPLVLPSVKSYQPTNEGESPLAHEDEWVETVCPVCGSKAKRETNTMPQWAGSCWYYLRYIDPNNNDFLISKEKEQYWMPVDLYIGGAEHAVLHLLYARFWHKVLYDIGVVSTPEPFIRLVNQGLITAFAYKNPKGSLIPTDMVEEKNGEYYNKENGDKLEKVIAKMSKSLKNVINPDDIISEYGADSMRLYEMFMGPLEMSKPWQTDGIIGIWRFVERIWKVAQNYSKDEAMDSALERLMHKTIKKVTSDTDTLNFNTAISALMVYVNELAKRTLVPYECVKILALLLSPYAPHIAEEIWALIGEKPSVTKQDWPLYNEELCKDDTITVGVQVNGKLRGSIEIAPSSTPEEMLKTAKEQENVKKYIDGHTVVKEIAIPGKIVNIVVK